ncbi:MAG: cytochrome C [Betaproteobacteria bacterium SG8_41]|jgi:D-alanine transaminase|nr:MAG: cytochrome C [Betaproteobacteria bacterium SG8_41]
MNEIVYLNGDFMPLENARIPVLDRGFIFGDGVYEVIPAYSRHPFRLPEHLARLQRSLDAIRLEPPLADAEWTRLVHQLIERNAAEDQAVYLQVTRGVAKRDHAFPKGVPPTVFMMSNPLVTPSRELVERGGAAITATDFRWLRCDVKVISLLGNCLLRQRSVDAGAEEVVMFRDGYLTEGSSSNIFAVRGGVLLAPPKNHLVLPGITYDVVLELAAANKVPIELREVSEDEVRGADELWLSSSSKEVLAVTTLDGHPVGDGKPGPVFKQIHRAFQDFKRKVMRQAA